MNNIQGAQHGLTIGLFNYASELHGAQIGLINISDNDGHRRVLPIDQRSLGGGGDPLRRRRGAARASSRRAT